MARLHEGPGLEMGSPCRFCGGALSVAPILCRGCGATFSRRAISVWPLLLFLPLLAFAAVLGIAFHTEMPPRDLVLAFPLAWLALAAIYLVWTRRMTWKRGDTLVLRDDGAATGIRKWMTPLASQWSMGATTAAIVGALWVVSAGQPLDPANAALVLPLDRGTTALAEARTPSKAVAAAPTAMLVAPLPLEKPSLLAEAPPAARTDEVPVTSAPVATTSTPVATIVAARTVEAEAPAAAPPAPAGTAESDEQAVILTAQKMLDGLGYAVGRIDGKPGSKTRVAVQSFREREGLGGGETIDAGLVAALERATAQRQAAIQRARQQAAAPAATRPMASAAAAPVAGAAVLSPALSPAPSSASALPQQVSESPSAPLRLRREPSVQSAKVLASSEPVGF